MKIFLSILFHSLDFHHLFLFNFSILFCCLTLASVVALGDFGATIFFVSFQKEKEESPPPPPLSSL